MSKILFVQIAPVGLHQAQPSDNGSTLIYNGLDTRVLKYTAAISTNNDSDDRPGVRFDFEEFAVVGVTFAQQNTQLLGTFNAETGTQQYQIWHTVVVPDNFALPTPPDLTIHLNSVTTKVSPSGNFVFDLTIKNHGTAPANTMKVGVYVSDDAIIDTNDFLLGSFDPSVGGSGSLFGPLGGGKSRSTNVSTPVSALNPAIPAGKHYFGLIVDMDNSVAESKENNNASNAILINAEGPFVDLQVTLKSERLGRALVRARSWVLCWWETRSLRHAPQPARCSPMWSGCATSTFRAGRPRQGWIRRRSVNFMMTR
jgi:hypothetical protein